MISEGRGVGVSIDQIIVLTLRIRTDMPELTVQSRSDAAFCGSM